MFSVFEALRRGCGENAECSQTAVGSEGSLVQLLKFYHEGDLGQMYSMTGQMERTHSYNKLCNLEIDAAILIMGKTLAVSRRSLCQNLVTPAWSSVKY